MRDPGAGVLQQHQPTSRWKVFSVQLLPMKQTNRKQINLQEKNLESIQTRAFVKVVSQCQQCHWSSDLDIHYALASAAEHAWHPHRSIIQSKMHSASVLRSLFCFTVFKYSTTVFLCHRQSPSKGICSPFATESCMKENCSLWSCFQPCLLYSCNFKTLFV